MESEFDLSLIIISSIGILSDIIFLSIYFKLPIVRHALGLQYIMISVIFNILYCSTKLLFIPIAKNNENIIISYALTDYTFISSFNWIFLYIFYLFQIICKRIPKESISLRHHLIYETLFTASLVSIDLIFIILIIKDEKNQILNLVFIVFVLCTYLMFLIFIIISIRFSYYIYLELKKKYHLLTRRALVDFYRLLSYPIVALILYTFSGVYHIANLFGLELDEMYFTNNLTGFFILICLLITQEMKDGVSLYKSKSLKLITFD